MESDDGFDAFGKEIKSDPFGVLLAKWQRDSFIRKLESLPDVIEVIPSGSLARGTHIGPVHDVDLIVVFDKSAHSDFGSGPESAQTAMTYLENKLLELLHPLSGTEVLIKGTEQRTHVVKCDGGSTGPFAEIIPTAPPVDVMAAVREKPYMLGKSPLLVPELGRVSALGGARESKWVDVDPETFMRQVEQRQREWKYFTEVVRMVKAWAKHEKLDIKSVAIEAMVLLYCPRPRMFETLSRGEALARFFDAAGKKLTTLWDPAGLREIDPGMNYGKLKRKLTDAAGLAREAMDAEYSWKNRFQLMQDATHPDVCWRKLFGKEYPQARERFWRAPVWEPWFDLGANWAGGGPKRPYGPTGPDDNGPKPPDDRRGPGGRGPRGPDDLDPTGPAGHPGGFFGGPEGRGRTRNARRRPEPDSPTAAEPGRPAEPASARSDTSWWTGVFGPAAAAGAAVPLTFG
jgi:Nucleotidyltransferase domain